jgi:transcriptional regulator with XRE-family HTH domain
MPWLLCFRNDTGRSSCRGCGAESTARRRAPRRRDTEEVLAVDAEIDRTYVSRLERGLENPTVAVLERLAKALSANIEELFRTPRARAGSQAVEGWATVETLVVALPSTASLRLRARYRQLVNIDASPAGDAGLSNVSVGALIVAPATVGVWGQF